MGQYRHPYNDEEREASGSLARFLVNKGWTEVVPVEVIEAKAEAAAGELKGQALDDALEANDLPKTGSADEKRERLAEHLAQAGQFGYPDVGEGPPPDPSQDQQDPNDAPEEQS